MMEMNGDSKRGHNCDVICCAPVSLAAFATFMLHQNLKQLIGKKKEFISAMAPEGLEVHHVGEAWWLEKGVRSSHSSTTDTKQK